MLLLIVLRLKLLNLTVRTIIKLPTIFNYYIHFSCVSGGLPTANQKPSDVLSESKANNAGKLRRRRRRQFSPNSIQIENSDNGKQTTALPMVKENDTIQILHENIGDVAQNYVVFDGPLDPNSNYTGFVEVIGKFGNHT